MRPAFRTFSRTESLKKTVEWFLQVYFFILFRKKKKKKKEFPEITMSRKLGISTTDHFKPFIVVWPAKKSIVQTKTNGTPKPGGLCTGVVVSV